MGVPKGTVWLATPAGKASKAMISALGDTGPGCTTKAPGDAGVSKPLGFGPGGGGTGLLSGANIRDTFPLCAWVAWAGIMATIITIVSSIAISFLMLGRLLFTDFAVLEDLTVSAIMDNTSCWLCKYSDFLDYST